MVVDHIGYAVKDINRSIKQFSKLGYKFENIVTDEKRNIYICFGTLGEYRIELVAPMKNGKPSPVDTYVKEHGNIPYHICYKTNDFEKDIEDLGNKGFKVILPPDTACAFGGKRVVFMMNVGMGILELVEN